MLNLDAIKSAGLEADPFDWALVERAIEPADADLLLDGFPQEDFWLIEDDDGEKSYSYAARPLVTLGADRLAPLSPLGAAWQRLGEALLSPSYRCALEELIGRSLQSALMEASVWRWDANAELGPHRDMEEKLVTQVFYLSREWRPEWGGCLRILRSQADDDVAAELPPINGSASVLVRSERSWHSVSAVNGAARQPRRSVIVTWFQPGSSSPVWKVGEDGAVACVAAGSVPELERASGGEAPNGSLPGFTAPRSVRGGRAIDAPGRLARRRDHAGAHPPRARIQALPRQPTARAPSTRVAMVGTFDIANFGDLLLPAIAAHELRVRVGGEFEPTLYAYRPMRGATWAHEVRSLAQLPREIQHFDLLLIGGGQIIRFDRGFPAGYLPSDPSVHHPLGLWLTPTLLAGALGVPVAWNTPGVAADIPEWLAPTIGAALAAVGHLSVRDEVSAELLRSLLPDAPACVVPDTGFGIRALLDEQPSSDFQELVSALGIAGGYVVVQPSAELQGYSREVAGVLGAARERGLAVLELPLSPCHGDRPGRLALPHESVSPESWPKPLVLAELLARAEAVIAQSFHAGVVAVAAGVPLYRPPSPPGWKYESLEGLERVHIFGQGSGAARLAAGEMDFGGGAPGPSASANAARLSSHWDAVAALARDGRRDGPPEAALALLADLPHQLHEHEALIGERLESLEADLAANEAAAAERIGALERSSATLRAQKDELAARLATLTKELAGARARISDLDGVRERKIVRLGLLLTRPLLWLRRGDQRSGAEPDP